MTDNVEVVREHVLEVIHKAVRADGSMNKARAGVSEGLMQIARECSDVTEFNQACIQAEAKWKAEKRGNKHLPKSYVQARSDIRRMYAEEITFTDGEGKAKTYSQAKNEAAKTRKKAVTEARAEAEKARPEYLKQFDQLFTLIQATKDEELITSVTRASAEIYREFLESHPQSAEGEEVQELPELEEAA